MPTNDMEDDEKTVEYAAECSFWQDSLLQSYRGIYLTVESIFLAIGVGLVALMISSGSTKAHILLFIAFLAFSVFGIFSIINMRGAVLNRGYDLDFWHNIWLRAEQKLPPKRRLVTIFKMEQQKRRNFSSPLYDKIIDGKTLDDGEIQELIGIGLGHTRKVFEKWLFQGIIIVWFILLAIGLVVLFTGV